MRRKLVALLIAELIKGLNSQQTRELLDDLIDKVEANIEASPSKIDDLVSLPIIRQLRNTLDIPDDIGGDED